MMDQTNEARLLKALKDIVEWRKSDRMSVGAGLALFAEALIKEIESE